MTEVFKLPELGENIEEAEILRVLVAEGDHVEKNQAVLEVESDKATVEVPSGVSGTIARLFVSAGETIAVGQKLIEVEEERSTESRPPEERGPPPPPTTDGTEATDTGDPEVDEPSLSQEPDRPADTPSRRTGRRPLFAAPSVRREARARGVDLSEVEGSGPSGLISRADVRAHKEKLEGPQKLDEPSGREISERSTGNTEEHAPGSPRPVSEETEERVKLSPTRRTIARRMAEAWRTIPHVTLDASAEISHLLEMKKAYEEKGPGDKITLTALLLKATTAALKAHPAVNSSLTDDGDAMLYHRSIHLGVAVDTDPGLVVTVIREAETKSVLELALLLKTLSSRARSGKLESHEMNGSTFSVTNLGGLGVSSFTPIINPPEAAVLGVSKARRSEAQGVLLPLSLSFDHRLLDGADGARFLQALVRILEDPLLMTFEC